MSKEELNKSGVKYDEDKLRYDLVPPYALEQLVKVYTFGSKKYADYNWCKGMKWSRVFGALMRHSWAFWRGEDLDPETGLPHMVHAAWNCMTLIEYMKYHRSMDDRWKYQTTNDKKEIINSKNFFQKFYKKIKNYF